VKWLILETHCVGFVLQYTTFDVVVVHVKDVGTHIKHANAAATRSRAGVGTNKVVPTISTKDISTVSLCTKAGCAGIQRKPIAAHPQGANEQGIHRSYDSVLLGRCK
jgi:hypothetical protein